MGYPFVPNGRPDQLRLAAVDMVGFDMSGIVVSSQGPNQSYFTLGLALAVVDTSRVFTRCCPCAPVPNKSSRP